MEIIKKSNNLLLLAQELRDKIIENNKDEKEVLFFCIGTDRCIGDSLGPIVGTMLKKRGFPVVGTLCAPVHAKNIEEAIDNIDKDNFFIVGIDTSLAINYDNVGKIKIRNFPLSPGLGVGKNLPTIGDISIIGCVGPVIKGYEYQVLSNVRLGFVYVMASKIVDIITIATEKLLEEVTVS